MMPNDGEDGNGGSFGESVMMSSCQRFKFGSIIVKILQKMLLQCGLS